MKDAYRQKGPETRKLYWAKNPVGFRKVSLHQGMAGVSQADDLASADQRIPDSLD